ncbi:alpha/beta hydrolase [Sphingomonas sp. ABOLD]|uniref:Pimeloyl-ACP methyl ester carboxylesterase n=1 Tax=Sphingomonas trueperi TaxID=53317 RepID=A0A7X5Y2W1_9SPHN|nr:MULTISPECIES: alpha/beta hydrolase [unclassified Sphingomonas]NJC00077.1 pimeloyl-ACP methyl ester carboxylesterase [Sphingomonas trueperi]RSV32656.1 alpha/beta hydrolase [Sphingomonas sp. ABOLE]RSV36417.1 alpha/beta hydrolase [Sphingomonas sp. ABOLD]
MRNLLRGALALAAAGLLAPLAQAQDTKPTIVLVHGAFADSSSWNGVIPILERDGYKVIAAPNPLRGVRADADVVADLLKSIDGPVVLVGHSYGGSVISEAGEGRSNVKALVFVAAFAPDEGETALALTSKFPGSTLSPTLAPPVNLTGGGKDLYILQARFHDQFAADVPASAAALMAAGQRPIAQAALSEASTAPAWKALPSWFIYGDQDRNIPPAAMAFMAQRAHARAAVVVKGASHVVMVSHAPEVARLIEQAATAH